MHVIKSTDTENEHQDNFCMPIRMNAEKRQSEVDGQPDKWQVTVLCIENMTIIHLPVHSFHR